MIGVGATLFKVPTAYGGTPFSPAKLFSNGEEGAWYDPSQLSSMFQPDGTTPTVAIAIGDTPTDANRVGKILDRSGNGNHLVQTTSTACPILRQDGSLYFLDFEGDDGLRTSSTIDFTGTDSMTVCAGVRKDVLDTGVIAELSTNVTGNTGAFRLASISTASGQYRYQSRGDGTVRAANASPFGVGTNVLTGISDISDPVATIRVDGTQEATVTDSQGAGNYRDDYLNVGARNNAASVYLDGRIYGLVVRGATSSTDEIDLLESYMALKTGVTL